MRAMLLGGCLLLLAACASTAAYMTAPERLASRKCSACHLVPSAVPATDWEAVRASHLRRVRLTEQDWQALEQLLVPPLTTTREPAPPNSPPSD